MNKYHNIEIAGFDLDGLVARIYCFIKQENILMKLNKESKPFGPQKCVCGKSLNVTYSMKVEELS